MLVLNNKTAITVKYKFIAWWKDHFASLLNKTSTVEQDEVDNNEERPTQPWMCKCLDLDKVSEVISMLRDVKSPGADGLNPEVIKKGGMKFVEVRYTNIKNTWENLEVPADWKGA